MTAFSCGKELRGGYHCMLDQGHRGRHTSIAFVCDGCGKTRPGYPQVRSEDRTSGDRFYFCFVCVKDGERSRDYYGNDAEAVR